MSHAPLRGGLAFAFCLATFPSFAAECTPVGFSGLTSRLVNPVGRVTGHIDARGCDIGVFYDRASGEIDGATIEGARAAAVWIEGEAAVVGINDADLAPAAGAAPAVVVRGGAAALTGCRIAAGPGPALVALDGARALLSGNRFEAANPRAVELDTLFAISTDSALAERKSSIGFAPVRRSLELAADAEAELLAPASVDAALALALLDSTD